MRKRQGGLDKAYQPSGTYKERISAQAPRADDAARAQQEAVDPDPPGPSGPPGPSDPASSTGGDNDYVVMGEADDDEFATRDVATSDGAHLRCLPQVLDGLALGSGLCVLA